ncbi:amino acid adenylation domain-containing protein [Streptomyces sp. NPDC127197]|uniref:non-ribosomal peptide synthetase n=1 Tax=Streptomyces sp. NPDC127197 TaxID=3345388 RepID=UPI0036282634
MARATAPTDGRTHGGDARSGRGPTADAAAQAGDAAPAVGGTPAEGGFTAVPRWTRAPVPGTAEHVTPVPAAVTTALHRRARELGVPLTAVFLAAHAKVLATLSGDPVVRTGYLSTAGTTPLPIQLAVGPGTWRQLLLASHRAESRLLPSRTSSSADAPPRTGGTAPRPEAVFDPTGRGPAGENGTVLMVTAAEQDGRRVVRLRYRTDLLDADCAARIAGYHLAALEQIAADPDAPHHRCSLLSAEEIRFQIDGLAGPRRDLPDRRCHELFEEHVRSHPGAVAAVHRDRQWTYGELNVRANRLARALLAQGLRPEDTVAVVTGRDLNWLAGVLAVFKAGGAYLPIDPHYPPGRMTTMLTRAACGFVLTEPGATTHLDRALDVLPGTRTLLVPDITERATDGTDPGVEVPADRLAYVFFTSGSTGEPKGAMCEHAGLLNHLYAKIDDLDIGAGTVVAQTASQCFDISLWQLLAGLLTGGRTLLVEQDAILDADRFLDTIVKGRVGVLQVVPSYLDVILSALERAPRDLPDLRCVSVTGEALKSELAQRWFTTGPGIRLVNAYGLTETSDDTNHEVMDRAPTADRVPLGRPVNNVRVYVVDDNLMLVPLGAPGAIVFSGVCVGRGYVNDPERTRLAYLADPYRPGQRLYRGGDFGRWLPDGKLEYLGRRDAQVKIRGFRVEIGEIENTLLRVPGVRDGAVVVTGEGHGRQLAAFYTSRKTLTAEDVRERLGDLLPEYLVPASFHQVARLPLTANGKTDTKALAALAEELDTSGDAYQAPRTPTEQRLAEKFATVLGMPTDRIGRGDNFFDLGGTSLSAVRLAVSLDRLISLRDLTRHPVLAELAGLIDTRTSGPPGTGAEARRVLRPLLPSNGPARAALVCFPDTGGTGAEFLPLAEVLRGSANGSGPTVHIAAQPDAARVAAETGRLGAPGILLWGDGSGASPAVEAARMLQQHGVPVLGVFLSVRSPFGLPHDAEQLTAPVTVLVAADTPGDAVAGSEAGEAAMARRAPGDWRFLAEHVDVRDVPGGGRHFLRTRPAEAAETLVRAAFPQAEP